MLFFCGNRWIPSLNVRSQLVIEHGHPDLWQVVRAPRPPSHLLSFDEAPAHHLVDGRLDETGPARLTLRGEARSDAMLTTVIMFVATTLL
ncbi:hypothetical protein D9M69_650450 [compost metagenome]